MDHYTSGARAGDADLMRPAFDPDATISGYCQGAKYGGSIEQVFEWINANGPAANLEASFARFEIIETLALVPLEATRWSGKLVGTTNRASDDFSLFKLNGAWKITHKLFHWHTD